MIKANFDAYNSYVTDSVHQWEINRTLSVGGLNLAVAPEVHFSNASMDKAIVRQATLSSHVVNVQIPNSLLQAPLSIDAYIGVYEGNAFKVVEHVRIPIIPRERPADYRIENDEEVYSFEALRNALANKADSATINARVDNIIAHNGDTDGNSELVDMRTADDGTIYPSAGAALRNHYARSNIVVMNFAGNIPFDFNFAERKITIRAYTRVMHANTQVFNSTADIVLTMSEADGVNANHSFCFDLANKAFVIASQHSAKNSKLIPVAGYYFHQNSVEIMENSLQCFYRYTIGGLAVDHADKVSIDRSRHRFGIAANAFGNPIDFDLGNYKITIPTHTYIFDGETRVTYNGGEVGAITVDIPRISGVKALIYNLTSNAWEAISDDSASIPRGKDTILIATWWPNTADSIVCPSNYTVDGLMPKYTDIVADVTDTVRAEVARTLYGKKVLIIGDSISVDSYGNYEKWVTKLCKSAFFNADNVTNNSIHATGFVARYNESENDFISRIKAVENPDEYDLVIVFGGINDYIRGIPMGESGGDITTSFRPAVDYFFEYLVNTFSGARICVLSPLRTNATWANSVGEYVPAYAEYIREVAKSYCLPVLNLTDESGFCPWVASFREKWTLMPDGYDATDGVHPTEEYGEKYLAPMIRGFLEKLL